MADALMTKVPTWLVTPEPYTGEPNVVTSTGVLAKGESTITLTEELESGAAVLLFLSGVCQETSAYNVVGTTLTLSEPVEEETTYMIVQGNLLLRTNNAFGTMALVNKFEGTEEPSNTLGKDGDFYIQLEA